jgi:hypothetical protein
MVVCGLCFVTGTRTKREVAFFGDIISDNFQFLVEAKDHFDWFQQDLNLDSASIGGAHLEAGLASGGYQRNLGERVPKSEEKLEVVRLAEVELELVGDCIMREPGKIHKKARDSILLIKALNQVCFVEI